MKQRSQTFVQLALVFAYILCLSIIYSKTAFAQTEQTNQTSANTQANNTSTNSSDYDYDSNSDSNQDDKTDKADQPSNCPVCPKTECPACPADKKKLDPDKPNPFQGSIQLGAIASTGDSEEFTENGAVNLSYTKNKMVYTGLLSALYNYDRKEDDHNERYQAQGQVRYNFAKKVYSFYTTNYLADSGEDYDFIWENQIGYGRQLFNSEKYHMSLDAQAGPGYRIAPTSDSEVADEQFTLNGTLIYNWQLTKATSFGETISSSYAKEDTITTFNTSITTRLYDNLGLQFASTLTNHTHPAGDTYKTSTYNTISLIYNF